MDANAHGLPPQLDFDEADRLDPIYRMPVVFGPSAGPRNLPASRRHLRFANQRTQITIDALTDAEAITRRLPASCRLAGDPVMRVSLSCLKDLGWLAGRGYNIVTVQFLNIIYEGEADKLTGSLDAVLWESLCDPVVTGREEIAIPKLFAAIPDPLVRGSNYFGSASWDGFRFFDIAIEDLHDAQEIPVPTGPRMAFKYVPRCGSLHEADAGYMTAATADAGMPPVTVLAYREGRGSFVFHPARWEDMPTQFHVVQALSKIPVREVIRANLRITSQGEAPEGDGGYGSGQRILS